MLPKDFNLSKWEEEGFLFQLSEEQYLLGSGPFIRTSCPKNNEWHVFHPPFFFSVKSKKQRFWYKPAFTNILTKKELIDLLSNYSKHQFTKIKWQEPDFSLFQTFFSKAKTAMEKEEIKKVVPVFFEKAHYVLKKNDILILIYRLILHSTGGIHSTGGLHSTGGNVYGFWSDKKAILGNTPEILFKKDNLYIKTMALAGTAQNLKHNLLQDPKEVWEHKLVAEEIKKTLTELGELALSAPYIYSIGTIQHLRTDFKLKLKQNISFEKLCDLFHPTPALGGVPKEKALALLAQLDKDSHLRHYFGAPFGIAKGDKSFCVVAIRNIQFIEDEAYIGSGCGLVKESVIEREWNELKKKRSFIKNILKL